jgi:hypothetical protein
MFVVGVQTTDDIAAHLTCGSDPVEHIFFGANMSFNFDTKNNLEWQRWKSMIECFLRKKYLCSLDIPVSMAEDFIENDLNSFNNFIPQISVRLPYVQKWNYNTMIKIDDRDFQATNPGVWCHSLHSLMNRSAFTDWSKYSEDKII